MGLWDFFKKKVGNNNLHYAPTMTGLTPFYTSFGESLYASDIIVQSIRCKANEFKKLKPRHIRTTGETQVVIRDSSIAKMLRRPNEYMTTADFLEKITILLELNKNVFIYPEYYLTVAGEKVYTGLYPLKPQTVDVLVSDDGKLFYKMYFANGYSHTFKAGDVIHWRKDFGVNDYFGGSMCGGNDDKGLLEMLKRYDMLCQSIAKALECSCQINGIVKINTYMDDDVTETKRKEFNDKLSKNESGILFTDLKTEYTNIPRDVKLVDAETLKFFYDTILRANGTSLAILNGDYTKAQKEAYYEHALEGDIKSLGQVMTKTLFTEREESHGNEVVLYPNDILFMSMENKISYMQMAVPAGAMTKNEIREFAGLPPIENGDELPRGYNNLDNKSANSDNQKNNDDNNNGGGNDVDEGNKKEE